MGFLRRMLRGQDARQEKPAPDPSATEAEEHARDLELLKEEQERFDELARRQLRYADYAWEPPAQGGERRADDADAGDTAPDGR